MLKLIKNLLKRNSLLLAILVTISITFLSLIKLGAQPISFTYLDKIEHVIAYMTLGFFWLLTFGTTKKNILFMSIICVLYGVLMEVLQSTTSYRTFDYADMIANSIGVGIGYLFFISFTKEKNIVK